MYLGGNRRWVPLKYVSQAFMNFEKLSSEQVFKNRHCNPFQSSLSLSTLVSFFISCVIYTLL